MLVNTDIKSHAYFNKLNTKFDIDYYYVQSIFFIFKYLWLVGESLVMNIVETHLIGEAKTSRHNKNKTISYLFIESTHSLCFNKREIILTQIQACEKLLKLSLDRIEKETIKKDFGT